MSDVPSYQINDFFDWLHFREIQIDAQSSQHEQLLCWAKQFLIEKWDRGSLEKDNLSFILKIFQNCRMIRETSVIEQMKHFCSCGQCFNYLYRRRDELNYAGSYPIDSLHPLLRNFLKYLNKKEFSTQIESCHDLRLNIDNRKIYFCHFIPRFGDQFFNEFKQYLESVDSSLIEDYIQNNRIASRFRNDNRRNRHNNNGKRTKPLGMDEELEEAIVRLVSSIEQNESYLLQAFGFVNSIKNLPQFLEFIEWLKKNYGSSEINQATSKKEIEKIVTRFCKEVQYDNVQQFSEEIINWLSPTLIPKIISIFLTKISLEKTKIFINLPFLKFSERYENIHFHGIFLFGKNNNISEFIKNHGQDLHDLTDDYMDIYYSPDDLKQNVTGYEKRKQFRNLDIEISHIPAFIIWKDSLTNSQIISFEGLSHEQMFDVVKHTTSSIEQQKSLGEVAEIARNKVKSYLNHSRALIMNNGDTYNVGQAVAVGHHATASNNTLIQVKQELESANLNTDSLSKLQELADRLRNELTNEKMSNDFSQSMLYEAVGKLLAIKEASEKQNQEEQAKAVTNWRQWFNGIGKKAQKYLGTTADVVSLGLPLLKLLGLEIPF